MSSPVLPPSASPCRLHPTHGQCSGCQSLPRCTYHLVVIESNPLSVTLGTLIYACLEQPTSKYDGHRHVFQCLFQNLLKTNEFTGHINFISFHLPSGFLSIILSLANADSFSPVLTANINNAQVTYHILQDDIWTTGQGSREPH